MLKNKFVFLVLGSLLLTGCDFFKIGPKGTDNEVQKSINGKFYGGLVYNEDYTGYEFSVSENEIKKPTSGIVDIDIYGLNDFHGAINESDREAGLIQIGSFLKNVAKKDNTLVFDQGDTWQGSFESNDSYGRIIREVYAEAQVSLRTVGNHDFDWGTEELIEFNSSSYNGAYTPTLAANVCSFTNGKIGKQETKIGKEYATFVLESGVKVGVVGVIGDEQISDISSFKVSNVAFSDHVKKVKDISDFLRTQKKCDIIVASTHVPTRDSISDGYDAISSVSHKRYVDVVLGGHAHSAYSARQNGVVYAQWDANGETVGGVHLHYDCKQNKLIDEEAKIDTFYKKYLNVYYPIDQTIKSKVDAYLESLREKGNRVLSTKFSGYFDDSNVGNLMAEAMYNRAKSAGFNVDFAVTNYARSGFENSTMLYSDAYKCFPFDNEVLIMDVKGPVSCRMIKLENTYSAELSPTLSHTQTYRIAVIDYLGLHMGDDRTYDYFPEGKVVDSLKYDNGSFLSYRDIFAEYLIANPDKTFNANDYQETSPHFYFA